METQALIFIPDISGYTKFVTETESRHSKHIISELIEVVLNSNSLKMVVSEIEGDAVLFFRKGDPPALPDLISQAKKMFIDFHTHLKIIQRDNVCQCGACRTAANLSLKFIAHYGLLEEVNIQNFTKIMGSDVILAHRLLKNRINDNEYLLMTDNYINTQKSEAQKLEPWVQFKVHSEKFTNFETVNIKYIPLSAVIKEVPDVTKFKRPDYDYSTADASIFIDAPILLVHQLLTDYNAKLEYIPDLKKLKNNKPINRINGTHTCVFDDLEIHFVTEFNEVKENEITYIEEAAIDNRYVFISDYKLKEEGKGTRLTVKFFPSRFSGKESFVKNLINRLFTRIALSKLKSTALKNLNNFKELCERKATEAVGKS